ncbi:MAG: PDDEXK nuclease domain-containing protein [bacterium]|nr:PDDEXK nuclease domain-containing protein [bacterium]
MAIELKVVKFIPEYIGKMQFYLAALDDLVREEYENPSTEYSLQI